jgi:hypothetical protein
MGREWVSSTFDAIERSRNVIMHTGLDGEDIERVSIHAAVQTRRADP